MSNQNPYKDDEIRHLIPIPECLTPMELEYDKEGNRVYVDNSGFVFYALMREQDTAFYSFGDHDPQGDFAEDVVLERTVHCKNCGQRMRIDDVRAVYPKYNPSRLIYRCPCGTECRVTKPDRKYFDWSR